MKQKIRLTESQLHRVIKESVRRILAESVNELNWKTYANAQREARKRVNGDRPLSKATSRKLNNPETHYQAWNDIHYADDALQDTKIKAFNDTHDDAIMTKNGKSDYLATGEGPFFPNGYDEYIPDERYKPAFFYTDARNRASEGTLNDTNDYSDYLKGNYDYQKGKGWQLKH